MRGCLEEARAQNCEPTNRNHIRGLALGRVCTRRRSPLVQGQSKCGGCAAKVGPTVLQSALERIQGDLSPGEPIRGSEDIVLGMREADDAAVIKMPDGGLLVSTVDQIRAFTDDGVGFRKILEKSISGVDQLGARYIDVYCWI